MPLDSSPGEWSTTVPEPRRARFLRVVALTDDFCAKHLPSAYTDLMRRFASCVFQSNLPVMRGRVQSWAAGIAYAAMRLDGGYDCELVLPFAASEVGDAFGVSESTTRAKFELIREALEQAIEMTDYSDLASHAAEAGYAEDDLPWLVEAGGVVLDLRQAPRDVQVEAFEYGLIPYVWADRHGGPSPRTPLEPAADGDVIARIGPDGITPAHPRTAPPAAAAGDGESPTDMLSRLSDLVEALIGTMSPPGLPLDDEPPPTIIEPRKPRGMVYVLRISLRGAKPPIWRRIAVRDDTTLSELHKIIQAVMGWANVHLHLFEQRSPRTVFSNRDAQDAGIAGACDEARYTVTDLLEQPGSWAIYEYDFGDSWIHRVELKRIAEPDRKQTYPICLAGRGACPPENCGGIHLYNDWLRLRSSHAEQGEPGRSAGFDVQLANQRLRFLVDTRAE